MDSEEWKDINRKGCQGLMVSNMGRIKSVRRKKEKLLKSKLILTGRKKKLMSLVVCNRNRKIVVHMEVLRAFFRNSGDDFRAVFIDGNRENCKAENLAWYGREYMVHKAIEMANSSNHPLAECFIRFWDGDTNALNDWFITQWEIIRKFTRSRFDNYSVPYFIDIEDVCQEVMIAIFINLRRGLIKSLDYLQSWVFGIAKNILSNRVRDALPCIPMIQESDMGEFNIIDVQGWCNPSAEIQAIYNEDVGRLAISK